MLFPFIFKMFFELETLQIHPGLYAFDGSDFRGRVPGLTRYGKPHTSTRHSSLPQMPRGVGCSTVKRGQAPPTLRLLRGLNETKHLVWYLTAHLVPKSKSPSLQIPLSTLLLVALHLAHQDLGTTEQKPIPPRSRHLYRPLTALSCEHQMTGTTCNTFIY